MACKTEYFIQVLKEGLRVPSDGDDPGGSIAAQSSDIRHAREDDQTPVRSVIGAEELASDRNACQCTAVHMLVLYVKRI